ncbi:hypothetical protein EDB92DRAFT_1911946 [Lactarius akahatsu]|uniref:F-box domain-containing protein n=1 Tax=Lactarius akahatsu TaxID=416441 RepID=A0AAD4L312_9AGAM|nr:hypothetical protein EDB92DRAFT_1911946 [Lactarius akahatsu]
MHDLDACTMAYWSPLYTNKPRLVGILALPDEILGKIIEDTELSEHDVLNLRCVNSTFRDLATQRAFWEVVVYTTDESTLGFLEFLVTPNIAKYVRDIKLVEDLGPVPHNFETERDEDERYKRGAFVFDLRRRATDTQNSREPSQDCMFHASPHP